MRFVRYDESQLKVYEGNSRYAVSPEEVARARIGLLASGGLEFLDTLPITHSMTEGSHSHRDTAEAVLIGNIALLGQLSTTNETWLKVGNEALVIDRIKSTIVSGIKALEDGAIAEAKSSSIE